MMKLFINNQFSFFTQFKMNCCLIVLSFFLSSCDFSQLKITLSDGVGSKTAYLEAKETESISTGAIKNNGQDTFSCKYNYESFTDLICTDLANLVFDTVTGVINWTPNYQQNGVYTFLVISSKGSESKIVIEVKKNNKAPTLTLTTAPSSYEEDQSYLIEWQGQDINGDELEYSYECASSNCQKLVGITLDSAAGSLTFSTDYESAGNYSFILKASDGELESSLQLDFTVQNVNRAPSLGAIGDKSVNENSLLTFNLSASDPDGDSVIYSYTCSAACPDGMSLVGNIFSWTPDNSQSGDYSVTFTATDNGTPVLDKSETITISVIDMNRAPSLAAISNQVVDELVAITTIDVNDSGDDLDVDGDVITYSCYYDTAVDGVVGSGNLCSSLSGLTFNTTTGVMNWTPALGSHNSYEFKIIGSDGHLTGSQIFLITVNQVYPLILTYKTTTTNEGITLPSVAGYTYNYRVDWGDGSALETVSGATLKTHNYSSSGNYVVRIYGQFPAINFYLVPFADRGKLISVNDLGRVGLVNLSEAFKFCLGLTSFSVGNGDTSNVTNMSSMFYGSTSLVSVNVSNLNTSNVTDMSSMFTNVSALTNLDLSNFNTTKVTSMTSMFSGASALTSLNLSSFNTSGVGSMAMMFSGASALTTLNLSNFNTSNVTVMNSMFANMTNLTTLNISSFDTVKVTNMSSMFSGAASLTALNLAHFNTANVVNMSSMFASTSKLTTLNLSSFDTTKVVNMSSMFKGAIKMTTLDLSSFNTSKVINMSSMFEGMSELVNLNLIAFPLFNTSIVTNMNSMFKGAAKLSAIDFSNLNTSQVTDMTSLFEGTTALTSLDFTDFDTTSVTLMKGMFKNAKGLTSLNLSQIKTNNVIDMESMFEGATGLTALDFSQFNTSKVTTMDSMFKGVTGVTTLDLSMLDTSKVGSMSYMFSGMTGLNTVNLTGWTLKNPLPSVTSIFQSTPGGKTVYCTQDPIGNTLGVTCSP